jgi:predicted transcriptional regulator
LNDERLEPQKTLLLSGLRFQSQKYKYNHLSTLRVNGQPYAPKRRSVDIALMTLEYLEAGPNNKYRLNLSVQTSGHVFERTLVWLLTYNLIRPITYSAWADTVGHGSQISPKQSRYIFEITEKGRQYLQKMRQLTKLLGDSS